jgi:hypothetical protein
MLDLPYSVLMFVSGCTGSIGADEDSAQNGQIEERLSEAMPYPYDHRMPSTIRRHAAPHARVLEATRRRESSCSSPADQWQFFLFRLSLGLKNAICNRASVIDTISS